MQEPYFLQDNKEPLLFHTSIIETTSEYERWFTHYHEQSCCEDVDVDLTHEEIYVPQIKWEFNKIEYRTAPEDWFFVKLYLDEEYKWQVYYPCHNIQNWYYSDELSIEVDWIYYDLQELNCVDNIIW